MHKVHPNVQTLGKDGCQIFVLNLNLQIQWECCNFTVWESA